MLTMSVAILRSDFLNVHAPVRQSLSSFLDIGAGFRRLLALLFLNTLFGAVHTELALGADPILHPLVPTDLAALTHQPVPKIVDHFCISPTDA